MHLADLAAACERSLREPYAIRLQRLRVGGVWTWRLDVSIADGPIVHAENTVQGAAVRAAHRDLAAWVARFGGSVNANR